MKKWDNNVATHPKMSVLHSVVMSIKGTKVTQFMAIKCVKSEQHYAKVKDDSKLKNLSMCLTCIK